VDRDKLSEMNKPRLLFGMATVCCVLALAYQACGSTNVAGRFDRAIIKEPMYQSTPKYSLITLGNSGDVSVWMVEDGKRLFVDKNANGDLTDDGPPIEPSKVRDLGGNRWDFEYALDAIRPTNGSRHTGFVLRRWNYNDKEDCYGLSLSVDGQMPMYAGWFGTFWSTNRGQAPVIHFGGPFTPKLLRRQEFTIGETHQRLSLCFINPGSAPGAESRLSIDALPHFLVPELRIEWPTAGGGAPLRTSYELTERCCYWEFYTTEFDPPRGIVPGKAKVSVRFAAGAMPIELTTTEIEAPVAARPQGPELEERRGDGVLLPKGSTAPDIEMVALANGRPERLSDYGGKIVLLEFWATWCGPCQKTLAELQGYAGKYPAWGDKVILIAASVDDNQDAAVKHLKAKGWDQTHNVWVRPDAMRAYLLGGIPAAYVIDRQGRIVATNPEDLPGFVNLEVQTKQGSEDKRQ
jgi:cytochrome c biogenesis protein CcmG, thiol:disulfide interchange protein DsbE